MKQRIRQSDLEQLSKEGLAKLQKLWRPRTYDLYLYGFSEFIILPGSDYTEKKDGMYPLVSIGQMIDFLSERLGSLYIADIDAQPYVYIEEDCRWVVTKKVGGGMIWTDNGTHELCDALWEAVKEVLNK